MFGKFAKASTHFPALPRAKTIVAHQHRRRLGRLDDLLQSFLPRLAGAQFPRIQPNLKPVRFELSRQCNDRRFVVAVVG